MAKKYVDTYIYHQYGKYEEKLYKFVLKADRIDTSSKEFEDILYDIKRRKVSNSLSKIITSDNIVLGISDENRLPKALKVFASRDLKEDKNKIKIFIDVTDCIKFKDGVYVCGNLEWLISYIIDAMVAYIHTVAPNRLLGNSTILKDGGMAFTKAFSYLIDRLYKISSIPELKRKVCYAADIYYQVSLIEKDPATNYDSIKANAIKVSDADRRDCAIVDAQIEMSDYRSIDTFVTALSRLGFKDLKSSVVITMWMNVFGTGTVFALEYFPAFSAMLTDAYVGGYLNQQITVEKITSPEMVSFTKAILQIGESAT